MRAYHKYSSEDYEKAMILRKKGLNPAEISRITGIKIRAIQGWIYKHQTPLATKTKEEMEIRFNKLRLSKLGSKNPNWKGEKVGWDAGHERARRLFHCPLLEWLKLECHHIDGNFINNDPSNIKFVSRKQHMTEDGRLDRLRERNRNGVNKTNVTRI